MFSVEKSIFNSAVCDLVDKYISAAIVEESKYKSPQYSKSGQIELSGSLIQVKCDTEEHAHSRFTSRAGFPTDK